MLARYNSDGSPDPMFDIDGKIIFQLGLGDIGTDIAVQPDGRILALGSTAHGSLSMNLDYDFALLRYNSNGSLDTTFDMDGKIILDFSIYDPADEIAIQPDGKIILSGNTLNNMTRDDFALVRLKVEEKVMTISGNMGIAGVTLDYKMAHPRRCYHNPMGIIHLQCPAVGMAPSGLLTTASHSVRRISHTLIPVQIKRPKILLPLLLLCPDARI